MALPINIEELHLTEGRGTGIPTMRRAMQNNGSAVPSLETDEQCTYFLTILPVHPDWLSDDQASTDQVPNKYRTSTGQVTGVDRGSTGELPGKYRASFSGNTKTCESNGRRNEKV